MNPFDASTHPDGGHSRRAEAADRLAGAELPSWELEEWRYSPVADLDFDRYEQHSEAALSDQELDALRSEFNTPNLGVTRNGVVVYTEGVVEATTNADRLVASNEDLFLDMNDVFTPTTLTVTAKNGAMVDQDIVVVHLIDADGAAVFTHLALDAGEAASFKVLEVFRSNDVAAFVNPQIEVRCAQASNVGYVARQELGPRVWQIGSQISEVDQQATFRSSIAAFGGEYARLRSDCRLIGRGAHGDLDAIYFGDGEQVLDFRTFQDHDAPDTTSNLLFKGVVDDSSRAIYTGLIRVAEEARGTQAYQTNRNIKLGEHSWAESVPNLEIETDDVRCSHASTVGPIDENQRYYLETRGVPPEVADELIVAGFFDEVIADLPIASAESAVARAVQAKLNRESVSA